MKPSKSERIANVVVGAIFVACINAPWVWTAVAGSDTTSVKAEMRNAAPRPELALSVATLNEYPDAFERWFSDTFGVREPLIRGLSAIQWFGFGVSPTRTMMKGKGDWLFTTADKSLAVHSGLEPFSEAELEVWRLTLEGRRDWLHGHGIAYALLMAPNKYHIYPEHLPDRIRVLGEDRLEQFARYIAEHSDFELLDVRAELREEKRNDREDDFVFYRLGTHWTDRSTFIACNRILASLATRLPRLAPVSRSDMELSLAADPEQEGDTWAHRMYLGGRLPQAKYELQPRVRRRFESTRRLKTMVRTIDYENANQTLPKASLYHDSFGEFAGRFLASHFTALTSYWSFAFQQDEILADGVDAVIHLYSERSLVFQRPELAYNELQDLQREQFEAATRTVYGLDVEGEEPAVRLIGRGSVKPDPQGLKIRLEDLEHFLVLPELPRTEGEAQFVKLTLTIPGGAPLEIMTTTDRQRVTDRRLLFNRELGNGVNEIYLKRFPHEAGQSLLMRLRAKIPGVLVSGFEVRVR